MKSSRPTIPFPSLSISWIIRTASHIRWYSRPNHLRNHSLWSNRYSTSHITLETLLSNYRPRLRSKDSKTVFMLIAFDLSAWYDENNRNSSKSTCHRLVKIYPARLKSMLLIIVLMSLSCPKPNKLYLLALHHPIVEIFYQRD
jgi:hypothetical protein